jgi:hypothetical protein
MFVEFPDFPGVRALAHPVRLSPSSPVSPRRPPAVGEHTREVLAELGYAPAQIDAMCGRNSNLRSEGTDHEDHRVHADRASSGGVSAPD